jgi:hypothetical protein
MSPSARCTLSVTVCQPATCSSDQMPGACGHSVPLRAVSHVFQATAIGHALLRDERALGEDEPAAPLGALLVVFLRTISNEQPAYNRPHARCSPRLAPSSARTGCA